MSLPDPSSDPLHEQQGRRGPPPLLLLMGREGRGDAGPARPAILGPDPRGGVGQVERGGVLHGQRGLRGTRQLSGN